MKTATPTPSRDACADRGRLEYVIECRNPGEHEKWLVVRPESSAPSYKAMGVAISPGCRVVVDAFTLRPVGVLDDELPPEPPSPFGYNPYYDMPPL